MKKVQKIIREELLKEAKDVNYDLVDRGLTSLKQVDFDENVGDLNCSVNELEDLDGCPKKISGDFDCTNNPGSDGLGFTEEDVRAVCKVKGKIVTDK